MTAISNPEPEDFFGNLTPVVGVKASTSKPQAARVMNPLLDEEDEDEPRGLTPAAPPKVVEKPSTAVDRKERRAAKRAANHAEHPVWYRRAITEKDLDFINFLVAHRYAKAEHLALIHGVGKHTAYKRLKGLQAYGYVEERPLHDTASIWVPTAKAVGRSKWKNLLHAIPATRHSWSKMPHTFVENYLAAATEGSTELNPLRLPEPSGWKVISSFPIEVSRKAPEGNPFSRYHLKLERAVPGVASSKVPDLVLRKEGQRPIAVEVELNYKGKTNTLPLLRLYGRQATYSEVIYVVPDEQDRKNIHGLWQSLSQQERDRITVLPLYLPDGEGDLVAYADDNHFLYRR